MLCNDFSIFAYLDSIFMDIFIAIIPITHSSNIIHFLNMASYLYKQKLSNQS